MNKYNSISYNRQLIAFLWLRALKFIRNRSLQNQTWVFWPVLSLSVQVCGCPAPHLRSDAGQLGAQTEVRSAGPAQIPCPPPLVSVSPLWFVASGLRSNLFFITSSVGHPYPSSLAESEHAVCYFISTTDTTKYDHSFAVVYFITIFLSCYFLFQLLSFLFLCESPVRVGYRLGFFLIKLYL